MSTQKHVDDELPELPPLDDDGSLFQDDEELIAGDDRESDLDDATAEDEPLDRFGAFAGIADDDSMLDAAEESPELPIDEERELLAGAEIGLLEDSHEGDGRGITSDEAGLFDEDEEPGDDGGAEGTGEDPSSAIEDLPAQRTSEAADDEGIDDDTRFEDAGAALAREGLEREPWPSRADVAWTIARAPERLTFDGIATTNDDDLIAATRDGALIVSTDGGATFHRVPCCTGVTAATILRTSRQRAVLAALHDTTRDASAIVLVRIAEKITAELVADFMADEADEDVRVTELTVRTLPKGDAELVEVLVRGPFGALLITPRTRG
jgi:hypothetical protein